ncbi:putative adipose-regulatory protein-domain-containing protein [Polychytrium aggregatum]|uniref:putative adipose-regulatory protein-domain-containing protein n=1 Tax=Polychytrium aggregatum TaxID=110093 RepID=UPI0022FE35F9|nr:putative adipose-regulatory protein-domain-containing protein [Polychytrium aggregatum]KAI9206370.1 putative adipose-regulatory protein-domain-containing protein [Polychytrium aggregatum]
MEPSPSQPRPKKKPATAPRVAGPDPQALVEQLPDLFQSMAGRGESLFRSADHLVSDTLPQFAWSSISQIRQMADESDLPWSSPKDLFELARARAGQELLKHSAQYFVINPIRELLINPLYEFVTYGLFGARTQKISINFIVFILFYGSLIGSALGIYSTFYYFYIPKVGHFVPAYMQYPVAGEQFFPHARVNFVEIDPDLYPTDEEGFLTPDQRYNFGVEFYVPDSDHNLKLGNFMVDMTLQNIDNQTLARGRRPALIRYRSPLHRWMRTIYKTFSLLVDWDHEAQHIKVVLVNDLIASEEKVKSVHHALVSFSSAHVQIYETKVFAEAHFQGLRFFMYNWWFTTGALFTSVVLFWEVTFGYIVWKLFRAVVRKSTKDEDGEVVDDEDLTSASDEEQHEDPVARQDKGKRRPSVFEEELLDLNGGDVDNGSPAENYFEWQSHEQPQPSARLRKRTRPPADASVPSSSLGQFEESSARYGSDGIVPLGEDAGDAPAVLRFDSSAHSSDYHSEESSSARRA